MGEEHNKVEHDSKCMSCFRSCIPFIVGLVVAMLFGWFAYPTIMYAEKKQPIAFNHVTHIDAAGMACVDCHYLREDGSFSGRPDTESCASCHAEPLGTSAEEERFIAEYVETGREIRDEWLIYAKQPDNVYFQHAAHSMETCTPCHQYLFPIETEEQLCATCHVDMSVSTTPPIYQENVLSTYSSGTMMMWQCEACHALPGHRFGGANASNACFVCHK